MDRVHPVIVRLGLYIVCATATGAGCGDDGASGGESTPSRVVAVQAARGQARTPADFCDVLPDTDAAPTFSMPVLAEGVDAPTDRWRWVNVWATWCAPCVEEI